MKCKNCGIDLLDTDQFCANCGQKVIKERRCPECGTRLRDGMKFCHECGCLVGGQIRIKTTEITAETIDIPIAEIEKNILLETEQEIGAAIRRPEKAKKETKAPAKPKSVLTEPKEEKPVREKKVSPKGYQAIPEEDWDEEEDDYEEKDHNIMTIVTVVMGFLIFSVAAFLIFHQVRSQPVKQYGESIENLQESETGSDESGGEGAEADKDSAAGLEVAGILTIDSNVNVRDNPGTEGTNIIKVAKAGEMYQYYGQTEDGEWYLILLEDGSIGYVFKDYVSVK